MTMHRIRALCLAGLLLWVALGAVSYQVAHGAECAVVEVGPGTEYPEGSAVPVPDDISIVRTARSSGLALSWVPINRDPRVYTVTVHDWELWFCPGLPLAEDPRPEYEDVDVDFGVSDDPPRGGMQINGPGRVVAPAERNPEPVIYDTAPPPVPGYSLALFGSEGPGR